MNPLVRLYILHAALGAALAAVFTALLLGLNVGNLRHLVASVEGGGVAVLMLVVFNAIVFGGVQFAIAVMRLGWDADDKPPGAAASRPPPRRRR